MALSCKNDPVPADKLTYAPVPEDTLMYDSDVPVRLVKLAPLALSCVNAPVALDT